MKAVQLCYWDQYKAIVLAIHYFGYRLRGRLFCGDAVYARSTHVWAVSFALLPVLVPALWEGRQESKGERKKRIVLIK